MKKLAYRIAEWCYAHDIRRRWKVNKYLRGHHEVKLHLGCWTHLLEGWLNTDKSVRGCYLGAVYMDVGKSFLLPDNSVDFVYSEHMFEHLTLQQARNMLRECCRVMKPGGVIRLATPNIKFLLDLYLHPENEINKRYIEWAAKEGNTPAKSVYVINRFHTAWGHQIIYDYESLSLLLEEGGFVDVHLCEMSKSDHPQLNDIEGHFQTMPYDLCCLETMIIEATIRIS